MFFPVFQGGKIFPPGEQENTENFRHVERNQRTPSPPTSVQLIYSITNIVGGGKIKRVMLRTLQYYHLILKMKQYNQLLIFTHEKYNYRQLRLAV